VVVEADRSGRTMYGKLFIATSEDAFAARALLYHIFLGGRPWHDDVGSGRLHLGELVGEIRFVGVDDE
jgi:hypothetical protein